CLFCLNIVHAVRQDLWTGVEDASEMDLRQHRTIWQAHSAKDFATYERDKRAGILYVFPPFITARMGRKIGRRPQTQLCGDALSLPTLVVIANALSTDCNSLLGKTLTGAQDKLMCQELLSIYEGMDYKKRQLCVNLSRVLAEYDT